MKNFSAMAGAPVEDLPRRNFRMTAVAAASCLLLAVCILGKRPDFSWLWVLKLNHGAIAGVGIAVFCISVAYLIFLLAAAFFGYRPGRSLGDAELPDCTVIVPAYNEGAGVLNAINSVLASDYPPERLHVVAIDDGSADDTWEYIRKAAEAHPGRLTPFKLPCNGGKRKAIYFGFEHSSGDVLVTVDSDSVVEKNALRHLVSPFADPRVGAVAGNIRVLNPCAGVLPQLMEVNFAFNFEIVRAAQDTLKTVFCTPGALSAYRRSALAPFIVRWSEQSFLGHPAGIGEDRALSSGVLKQGLQVRFRRDALAYTRMPTTFDLLCKMFMRWGRGDFRETLLMYGFAFRRGLGPTAWPLRILLLLQSLWLITPIVLLPVLVGGAVLAPASFFTSMAWTTTVWGILPAAVYCINTGKLNVIWGCTFSVFNFFFLFWMMPYCCLTMTNSRWLTRNRRSVISEKRDTAIV